MLRGQVTIVIDEVSQIICLQEAVLPLLSGNDLASRLENASPALSEMLHHVRHSDRPDAQLPQELLLGRACVPLFLSHIEWLTNDFVLASGCLD